MNTAVESPEKSPVELIIEEAAYRNGGQVGLAKALGVSAQAITKWKDSRVPAERVLDFERVTGIPRHRIRPDIYPVEVAS